ncbi:MAG: patatin-like phospholipase family protein [Flavobacteriales bacterium]|nr:patatin-like phospholipase family protein [Flavobacteriales bacterium]
MALLGAGLSLVAGLFAQGVTEKPKRLGLVLSGGGAKGLAHIGVLKVLEEEGLRPEVITGTSMGSLIGGLYACGYSAAQIEAVVLDIHWDDVLTNKIPLDRIAIEEKPFYGRFLLELPFNGLKPSIPSGLIRGQKIDELIRRLTLPYHGTTNFDSLPIPFACVATDVGRGQAVLQRHGLLADALRASMSIPTVFSPPVRDTMLLVDGGTLRNFPVSDAKDMGADLVIGVQVGDGLVAAEDLHSGVDILMQASMFISLLEDPRQKALCDVYLRPDLTGYGTASFTQEAVPVLIQRGYAIADQHRAEIRALAAQLPASRRNLPPPVGSTLPDSIRVDRVEVVSDRKGNVPLLQRRLVTQGRLAVKDLEERIDLLYGTLNYDLINYRLDPGKGDSALVVKAVSAPHEKLGVSLNFDNFNQASAGVLLISRDRLLEGSRILAEAYIGRYPQVGSNFLKYVGRYRRYAILLGGFYSRTPYYVKDVDEDVVATMRFGRYGAYFRTQTASSDRQTYGLELGWENTLGTPTVGGLVELPSADTTAVIDLGWIDRLSSQRWAARFFTEFDNTDRPVYPRRGWKLNGTVGTYWGANATYAFSDSYLEGFPAGTAPVGSGDINAITYDQFQRVVLQAATIQEVSARLSILAGGAFSLCSERDLAAGDRLLLGGMKANGRESIAFWGLSEYDEQLSEFAMVRAGWQWEVVKNLYWQVQANGLFTALRPGFEVLDSGDDSLWGVGTTVGLRTGLGVVQVGSASSFQGQPWLGYFNFGFRL